MWEDVQTQGFRPVGNRQQSGVSVLRALACWEKKGRLTWKITFMTQLPEVGHRQVWVLNTVLKTGASLKVCPSTESPRASMQIDTCKAVHCRAVDNSENLRNS